MDFITALAVAVGLLGMTATYLFVTLGTIQMWIASLGWASFYHCGGGMNGFRKSVAANLWGVSVGFIALLLITQIDTGLSNPLWQSIVVGITASILVLGTKIEAFSEIPATFYGYAATAGYGFLSGASLTVFNIANPLACVTLSLIIGAVLGITSEQLAGILKGKDPVEGVTKN